MTAGSSRAWFIGSVEFLRFLSFDCRSNYWWWYWAMSPERLTLKLHCCSMLHGEAGATFQISFEVWLWSSHSGSRTYHWSFVWAWSWGVCSAGAERENEHEGWGCFKWCWESTCKLCEGHCIAENFWSGGRKRVLALLMWCGMKKCFAPTLSRLLSRARVLQAKFAEIWNDCCLIYHILNNFW